MKRLVLILLVMLLFADFALADNPPTSLVAVVNGDNHVVLTWTNPDTAESVFQGIVVERKYDGIINYAVIHTTTDPTLTAWTDTNPLLGSPSLYRLFSVYEQGLSEESSNEYMVIVPSFGQIMLTFDSGIVSSLSTPVATGFFANRIDVSNIPDYWYNFTIRYVMVYIKELGTSASFVRIWNENEDNQPGTMVLSINSGCANAQPGWHYIPIPLNDNSIFDRVSIYVGFFSPQSVSPRLGISLVDNPTVAYWTNTANWVPFTEGNFMIRVLVEVYPCISETDVVQKPSNLTAKNYPNPFNPETTIEFYMPYKGKVSIDIFNIKGQLLNTIFSDEVLAGDHRTVWSGLDSNSDNIAGGIYFYRVQTEKEILIKKMMLLK